MGWECEDWDVALAFDFVFLELGADDLSPVASPPCRRLDPLLLLLVLEALLFGGGALSGSCLRPTVLTLLFASRLACHTEDGKMCFWATAVTEDGASESLSMGKGLGSDSDEDEVGRLQVGPVLRCSILGETVSASGKTLPALTGKPCTGE